jgi:DNA processing protein
MAVLSPMLGGDFREPAVPVSPPLAEEWETQADGIRAAVEEALSAAPVAIDELIRQTGAPAAAILTVILELELAGRCIRQPGGRVCWS